MSLSRFGALALASQGVAATEKSPSLVQSWSGILESTSNQIHDTPVTRVVGLLKNMAKEVKAEQDEDESLYRKLKCWCNDNDWEKGNAIEAGEAKIDELKATIESLTGSTAELRTNLKDLRAEIAADKKALSEATALREKQLDEFHNMEKDSVQAIENLKAAITVLAKHHGSGPDSTVAGGPVFKTEKDSWGSKSALWGGSFLEGESLVQTSEKEFPSKASRSLDTFLRDTGLDDMAVDAKIEAADSQPKAKFLSKGGALLSTEVGWSPEDTAVVKRALTSANSFVQSRQGYYPAYSSQSGEINGVLKQLKEEMEGDLSEAQKTEMRRAEDFADLRAAKTEEITSGEKMEEEKEDLLANQDNLLAEAKEDLGQEEATLAENKKFLANVEETCAKADKNYDARKDSRLKEMAAISETIDILTGDEARDAMSGTFNFLQVSRVQGQSQQRRAAADALRKAAKVSQDPQLSVLATSVELDAFTKVKKAIDDMIGILKQQQEDEVKKTNFCKKELQSNEMATAKKTTEQEDLLAKIDKLENEIKTLEAEIADAKSAIAKAEVDLQRASQTRKAENQDFQKVIADQTMTIEVLHKALDRLATYYDLVQVKTNKGSSWIQRQTPPVPEMEYKKNKGAGGVMEMIEKLVYDSRELMAASKKSEMDAQGAYEQLISETNDSVAALQKSIVSKTDARNDARKDRREAKSDLSDAMKELEELAKYNAELHAECDYVLKNFDLRQQARAAEITALQEAKQILNGATLN